MCGIVPSPEALDVLKEGVGPAVGAFFATMFIRRNSRKEEIEKIKAGQFADLANKLLEEGKLSYQEYYRCNNFLQIAKLADERLRDSHSDEHNNTQNDSSVIDFDWLIRFYDAVGTVSNEEMRELWARVLAGETRGRGSFSLRAIELLHNMSVEEAQMFKSATRLVLYDGTGRPSVICTTEEFPDVNTFYGINSDTIEALTDCGILLGTRSELALFDNVDDSHLIHSDTAALLLQPESEEGLRLSLPFYPLSGAAIQLLDTIDVKPSLDYMLDLGKTLSACYEGQLRISAREIISIDGDTLELDFNDLLTNHRYAAEGLKDEVSAVLNGRYGRNTAIHNPPTISFDSL